MRLLLRVVRSYAPAAPALIALSWPHYHGNALSIPPVVNCCALAGRGGRVRGRGASNKAAVTAVAPSSASTEPVANAQEAANSDHAAPGLNVAAGGGEDSRVTAARSDHEPVVEAPAARDELRAPSANAAAETHGTCTASDDGGCPSSEREATSPRPAAVGLPGGAATAAMRIGLVAMVKNMPSSQLAAAMAAMQQVSVTSFALPAQYSCSWSLVTSLCCPAPITDAASEAAALFFCSVWRRCCQVCRSLYRLRAQLRRCQTHPLLPSRRPCR
jgi:hypothetical protein